MAAKEYIHFIDDLGVHLTKREFDNGAKIWDAAVRSAEALKPSAQQLKAAIDMLNRCVDQLPEGGFRCTVKEFIMDATAAI